MPVSDHWNPNKAIKATDFYPEQKFAMPHQQQYKPVLEHMIADAAITE